MTAGGTTGNVRLGPGRLSVAPLATAEPSDATTALPSTWRPIGYTEQGSAFSTTLTNSAVEVEEEIDPILYVLSKRENTLVVALAELTRRNLALALGSGAAAANTGSYEPPDPGSEVAVMIVWDSDTADVPTSANTRWLFRQCKAGGSINISRRKSPTKATIAETFSLEKPSGLAPYKVFPNASGLI